MDPKPTGRQRQSQRSRLDDTASSGQQIKQTTETAGASVIIPTYNERKNITTVIERCLSALDGWEFEIIVVDDDSPDGTWNIAEEAFDSDPRVRVIRRRDERGLATAVVTGFSRARYEYCAVIDADLQHPPETLPDLLTALADGADVAVGSRHAEGGGIEDWSRLRTLVSNGASHIADLFVPDARRVSDPMSGFFALRRDILDDVTLDPAGYKILLEVLTKCSYGTIEEVPYVFREREHGESKLTATQYQRFIEHAIMLAVTSRGLGQVITPRRATRVAEFATVGGIGALVNMGVFMAALSGVDHPLLAGGIAFLAAVNSNFLGNWAITFDNSQASLIEAWGKFHLVSATGFILYTVFLSASLDVLLLPAFAANIVAIAGSSVFNFAGSEQLAFASEEIK